MAGRRGVLEQRASRAFTGLMLVYSTVWDEAYTALCDMHTTVLERRYPIDVAAFSLAWSEANGKRHNVVVLQISERMSQ